MNFIYQLFSHNKSKVVELQKCPIILSIMSIRYFYPKSKIFVIDHTPHYHDWESYQKKLDIQILKIKNTYRHIPLMYQKILHIRDNFDLFDELVCGIDADVIIKNNYSFIEDNLFHVYFNRERANCGLYYFKNKKVCELWCEYINSCFSQKTNIDLYLKNKIFHKISDEAILSYLIGEQPVLFTTIKDVELIGNNYKYSEKNWYHFLTIGTKKKIELILKFQDFHEIFKTIKDNKNLQIDIPLPTTTLKKYYNTVSFL